MAAAPFAAAGLALLTNPETIRAIAHTARALTEFLISLARDETVSPEVRAAARAESQVVLDLAAQVRAEALEEIAERPPEA